MSTQPESNDEELDKLLAELEKPSEDSNPSEKIKDVQAEETLKKIKHENPYKDKKNDEYNEYEYSDKLDEADEDW